MEYIVQLLSGYIDNEATLQLLFVVLVGLAVFAAIISAMVLGKAIYSPVRRRLAGLTGVDADAAARDLMGADLRKGSSTLSNSLGNLEKYVAPRNQKEIASVRAKLIQAGYRQENTYKGFYALKTLLCLVFGLTTAQISTYFPELSANETLIIIAGAAFAGLALPNMVLDHLAKTRTDHIRRGFPDALDLFVVCVESGLGLAATIQRVGAELDVSHPELSEELNLVDAEMRLGVDRISALRGLAERTCLDEIKGLVALLDQSARFGTSVADTLRVYSDEFRDKRMQAAEEIAAKIGTKLIFPLTFCMWPSFFVVAIGPAILKVIEAFK
jgi:tight adherence protein C